MRGNDCDSDDDNDDDEGGSALAEVLSHFPAWGKNTNWLNCNHESNGIIVC